jgi:hypothetical protein
VNEFDDPADVLLSLSHPGALAPQPDEDPVTATGRFRWMWASTAAGARVPEAPGWTYDDGPSGPAWRELIGPVCILAALMAITAAAWWGLS